MKPRTAVLCSAVGFASGLRSAIGISGFLLLTFRKSRYERHALGGAVIAVAGEFVMDKLPSTPSRLQPQSLAARAVAGGGAAFAIARTLGEDIAPAAALGAVGALAGSYAGSAYRSAASKHVPATAAAVAEDAVALTLGAAVLREVLLPVAVDVPFAR